MGVDAKSLSQSLSLAGFDPVQVVWMRSRSIKIEIEMV